MYPTVLKIQKATTYNQVHFQFPPYDFNLFCSLQSLRLKSLIGTSLLICHFYVPSLFATSFDFYNISFFVLTESCYFRIHYVG